MCFCEANHGFELAGGGGYTAIGGADVIAQFPHANVGVYQRRARFRRYYGVDMSFGVGNVAGEEFDGLENGGSAKAVIHTFKYREI